MKVALGQLAPKPGRLDENIRAVAGAVHTHPGADLVVFPELFLGGYDLEAAGAHAIPRDAPALDPLRHACAAMDTAVIVGFAERLEDGVANAAVAIDRDGRLAGVIHKTHLFGGEREVFRAGRELRPLAVLDTEIGLMICFDLEFPEVARALAMRGARVLVTIAANMDPFGPDHELFARARALENGLPHVYVNRVGQEGGFTFTGGSCVISADGVLQAGASDDPTVLELSVGSAGHYDPRLRYADQLRPDLYPVVDSDPARTLRAERWTTMGHGRPSNASTRWQPPHAAQLEQTKGARR